MPRRAAATARPIESDAMYGSKLVQQLINKVMVAGKKSTAEQIVYDALDTLAKRVGQLSGQPFRHRLLAAAPGELHEPAHCEGLGPALWDLDRYLVGGAAHAA